MCINLNTECGNWKAYYLSLVFNTSDPKPEIGSTEHKSFLFCDLSQKDKN
jgi:hypothetical protein